ncbi:hypothetical protein K474DRAFT_1695319 [Panus rudis PR-1116 ss-1]|nr:hypothetical protein K474DRAFT_1695319 [Panus rudis PR-1116 ss-1]
MANNAVLCQSRRKVSAAVIGVSVAVDSVDNIDSGRQRKVRGSSSGSRSGNSGKLSSSPLSGRKRYMASGKSGDRPIMISSRREMATEGDCHAVVGAVVSYYRIQVASIMEERASKAADYQLLPGGGAERVTLRRMLASLNALTKPAYGDRVNLQGLGSRRRTEASLELEVGTPARSIPNTEKLTETI